ncbi:hypothetical protein [Syntrophotalea acetylenica]|nr:hypothetical protein [Syntrophotalea acetylenica]
MSDQKVADDLPEEILSTLKTLGYATTALRDEPHLAHPDDFCRAQEQFDRNLAFLERRLFPLHGMTIFGRGGGFS